MALFDLIEISLKQRSGPMKDCNIRTELFHGRHLMTGHDQVFALRDLLTDHGFEKIRIDRGKTGQRRSQIRRF